MINSFAGVRNGMLVLFAVALVHMLLNGNMAASPPNVSVAKDIVARAPVKPPRMSTPVKELKSDDFMAAWPPGPDDLSVGITQRATQRGIVSPSTKDADERAALHRLVFADEEPSDKLKSLEPSRYMDYSSPQLSAEGGTSTGLFKINNDPPRGALNDDITGIEGWGAGFAIL